MFDSFTATGTVAAASGFTPSLITPALVVIGVGVALGLTGWVVSKMRRSAR